MLTDKQFLNIVDLQSQMNSKINPDWINANYPFLRAAMMEGAEAIEHTGRWKWWKGPRKMDLPQLQMELVDIFHFIISAILVWNNGDITQAAKALKRLSESPSQSVDFDSKTYFFNQMELVDRLELMIGMSVSRRVDIPLFSTILTDCQMSWEDLYRQYIGKNILNLFRQDNGYKEGTYRKIWMGREDNVHLAELILTLDATAEDFREKIVFHLNERYMASTPAG
jgi:dimeric dUTPase (all-alpha-NTP-PPase superfamily)